MTRNGKKVIFIYNNQSEQRGARRTDSTGLTSPSPTYIKFLTKWKKCRDAIAGEDDIKENGQTYLPKPSGMDDDDYKGYKDRAQFFNAAGRTLDGLGGMLNRKMPIISVPDGMEKYLENVDGKGHTMRQFIDQVCKDALITGWGGILVDMPESGDNVSQADFERKGLCAYLVHYKAESITKHRWHTEGRSSKLEYVILKEPTEVKVRDSEFSTEIKEYWRVLKVGEDGIYKQTLYDDKLAVISELVPKSKKDAFVEIPFSFVSANSEPEEPILSDLINVNLSHYRKSADYENGLHWTGVPTPYERGWVPETKYDENGKEIPTAPMKLGGSQFLYFPQGTEQVGYLEFGGSGLSQLSLAMDKDEERMAILGARIIANQKKGVEAAETAKIHNAAENSVLASFANNMSQIFSRMLRIYLEWTTGQDIQQENVKVEINTDYDVSTMSPAELTALVSLWQSGGIAKRDLFRNLKEGEILDNDRNLDEMNAEIDEELQSRTIPPAEQ